MVGELIPIALRASAGLPKMRFGRRTEKIVATEMAYLFSISKSVGRERFPADVAIDMDYAGQGSEISTRTVWVKSSFMFATQVYLHGFCEHRRKDRTFKLTRATKVALKDPHSNLEGHVRSIPMALGLGQSFGVLGDSDFFVPPEIYGDLRRPLAILLKKMMDVSIAKVERPSILFDFSLSSLCKDLRLFAPTAGMATGACVLIDRTDLKELDWKAELDAMKRGRFDKAAFQEALDRIDENKTVLSKKC